MIGLELKVRSDSSSEYEEATSSSAGEGISGLRFSSSRLGARRSPLTPPPRTGWIDCLVKSKLVKFPSS
eukprot:scaffold92896_cov30-Tisochrysis_lutea.AAC.1